MQETAPSHPPDVSRRSGLLCGLLVGLIAGVLVDKLVPGWRGRLAGLVFGGLWLALIVGLVGGVRSSRRRAWVCGGALLLMPCVLAVAFAPNLQRLLLQRRVEGVGGFVETVLDPGDGVWFPFEDIQLPWACRRYLGDAFFAERLTIRLRGCRLTFEQIRQLQLQRPADHVDLSGAILTPGDLQRTISLLDVRSLDLAALSVEEPLLLQCGRIPSLEWLDVRWTTIDDAAAERFTKRCPHIMLLYGRGRLQIRKGTRVLR